MARLVRRAKHPRLATVNCCLLVGVDDGHSFGALWNMREGIEHARQTVEILDERGHRLLERLSVRRCGARRRAEVRVEIHELAARDVDQRDVLRHLWTL